jgi:hypothetical protein
MSGKHKSACSLSSPHLSLFYQCTHDVFCSNTPAAHKEPFIIYYTPLISGNQGHPFCKSKPPQLSILKPNPYIQATSHHRTPGVTPSVTVNLDRARFVHDVGMATITAQGHASALSFFDHFLVKVLNEEKLVDMQLDKLDADVEDILQGYSLWMRDTNIKGKILPHTRHTWG